MRPARIAGVVTVLAASIIVTSCNESAAEYAKRTEQAAVCEAAAGQLQGARQRELDAVLNPVNHFDALLYRKGVEYSEAIYQQDLRRCAAAY